MTSAQKSAPGITLGHLNKNGIFEMWYRFSLRNRVYLVVAALVFITTMGGFITIWHTYQSDALLSSIIDRNLEAFQAADALEHALVNQKGFVTYYFLDNDPEWLRQLGGYRQVFIERLHEIRSLVENDEQKEAIDRIDQEYRVYITGKDRVIDHYKAGQRETGLKLHKEVRSRFFIILELCEKFKAIHTKRIADARTKSLALAKKLRIVSMGAITVVLFLGILLIIVLITQILNPLLGLVKEMGPGDDRMKSDDLITTLSRGVHGLIQDAGQTHIELERSREHLLQAEKMVLIGKLAAGMAHSIRNPLTSVKMRLFSLGRSLELTDYQKEDFDVISEEIRHTDTIVQNFLEFSRPPRLKTQKISPSAVVDMTIQLLEHRLKSYDVNVKIIRKQPLPEIQIDPEQLKEVFVNIIENACEAMGLGGSIVINEEENYLSSNKKTAVIRLIDTGPGIPESIKEKVFEPFFTNKDEGTGLGLSIALRIIEEHGGRLDVESKEGGGTTFIIALPIEE
ncbi:MAG: ATP-binding protein [Pseudomonadota bacterium]